MSTADFLATLRERDVRIWVEAGRLLCDAPPGVLDDSLRAEVAARKGELLDLISRSGGALTGPRSVVPLKPTGDLPPLLARGGHNGDVFCYRALATLMDERRPLFGVEPMPVGDDETPSVEELAAYEVEQIRAVTDGPYLLAGYCAGGAIAFESARQLRKVGADVSRVILIGTPFPAAYRAGRFRTQLRSLDHRARLHSSRIAAGSFAEGMSYLGSRAAGRFRGMADRTGGDLAGRRRLEEATIAAVKEYEPGYYDGRIDLVLPTEDWRRSADRPDDWSMFAAETMVHVGPRGCDGDSMLQHPYVGPIAGKLNALLGDEGRGDAAGH